MYASYFKYLLHFKNPSGTSRGILTTKESWFIVLEKDGKKGIGECGILRGLSVDDRPDYEVKLQWVCQNIALGKGQLWEALMAFPSIQFGVEMAFLSLASETPFLLFPSTEYPCGSTSPMSLKKEIFVGGGFPLLRSKLLLFDDIETEEEEEEETDCK